MTRTAILYFNLHKFFICIFNIFIDMSLLWCTYGNENQWGCMLNYHCIYIAVVLNEWLGQKLFSDFTLTKHWKKSVNVIKFYIYGVSLHYPWKNDLVSMATYTTFSNSCPFQAKIVAISNMLSIAHQNFRRYIFDFQKLVFMRFLVICLFVDNQFLEIIP